MIKFFYFIFLLTQLPRLSHAVECASYQKTCSNPGAETTVFVDLNSQPNIPNKEINCARKAACERKQNIIVFPGSDKSITPDNIAAKFKEFISNLDQQNVNMNKMILSGHDGGSNYGGERGALSFNQIDEAFQDNDKKDLAIKSKVKSLYGWGCYTATINEVDKKWLKSFPNLDYMLGYDLKAPLSDKKAGYEFLYEALAAEAKINETKTVKDFSSSLNNLEWANSLHLAAFLKTCENGVDPTDADSSGADGFYLSTTYGDLTLKEAKEKCKILRLEVEAELTIYNQYLYGDKAVPGHGTESPLRAFYNKLRATESCEAKGNTNLTKESPLPKPDDVIMLIYDDYLMSNFFSLYASDLEEVKAVLKSGFPDKDLSALLPKKEDLKDPLYRKKFAENIFQLNKEIAGIERNETEIDKRKKIGTFFNTANDDQRKSIQAVNNLNDMLFDMRVPLVWRDEAHSTKKGQPLIPDQGNSGRAIKGKPQGEAGEDAVQPTE